MPSWVTYTPGYRFPLYAKLHYPLSDLAGYIDPRTRLVTGLGFSDLAGYIVPRTRLVTGSPLYAWLHERMRDIPSNPNCLVHTNQAGYNFIYVEWFHAFHACGTPGTCNLI